jgi:pimeloyl-ACP methyl ester carboxylesterase
MIDGITADGKRISFWKNDDGFSPGLRNLVFIHGSGGSHNDWDQQLTRLQSRFNVVAIDLPGHGNSAGKGEQDIFSYVSTVETFLDIAALDRPILVGHSLGAAICLGFAVKKPNTAAAIALLGGGAKMPVNPLIFEGLGNDPSTTIATISKMAVAMANREKYAAFIASTISRTSPETIHGDFTACNRLDLTAEVEAIRIPALIICGKEDKMTPPAMSEWLRDNIQGARMALIPEAGHFAMLENPEVFNSVITAFTDSLPY